MVCQRWASALCNFVLAVALWAVGSILVPSAVYAYDFDPTPMQRQAAELLDSGRILEAADTYLEIYRHAADPTIRAQALVTAGDIQALFLELPDQALQTYARVIQEFPDSGILENAYFNSGMLTYELGQLERAQAFFGLYLHHFPTGKRLFTAEFMRDRIRDERRAGNVEATTKPDMMSGNMLGKATGRATNTPANAPTNEPISKADNETGRSGDEPVVRVALLNTDSFRLDVPSEGTITVRGQKLPLHSGAYSVVAAGDAIVMNGRPVGGRARISVQNGVLRLNKKGYAGELEFSLENGRLLVINHIPMEQYLEGVVPREMSASFKLEALKAQAVAARSYAYFMLKKSVDKPYDVSASTASQVYGGVDAGDSKTSRAVTETRGRILTYDGKVVLSYFHSHSGGMLEDDKLVWSADMPYYDVRNDAVSSRTKRMGWKATVSAAELQQSLRKKGFHTEGVNGIRAGKVSPSGRLVSVIVLSQGREIELKANAFRLMVGASTMKSTLCNINKNGASFDFSGTGYGHGVGMSQWGAQGMASEGSAYTEILHHYYPQTQIRQEYN